MAKTPKVQGLGVTMGSDSKLSTGGRKVKPFGLAAQPQWETLGFCEVELLRSQRDVSWGSLV